MHVRIMLHTYSFKAVTNLALDGLVRPMMRPLNVLRASMNARDMLVLDDADEMTMLVAPK